MPGPATRAGLALVLAVSAAVAGDTADRRRETRRAVVLSLDGLGAAIADDAMARGIMPRLARLRTRGASARGVVSALPTKTAPGHAALFTGAWGDRNGITGNQVPVPGASVLEGQSGFRSTPLAAEPLWFAAARQGLDAVVVSAPNVFPFSVYSDGVRFRGSPGRRLTLFDGYEGIDAADGVFTAADVAWAPATGAAAVLPSHRGEARAAVLPIAGARVGAWAYDDPADPVDGLDTVLVAGDAGPGAGVVLKPSPPRDDPAAFGAIGVALGGGEATIFVRLHELAADGSRLLLWHSAPHLYRSNQPRLDAAALRASGGFAGNGAAGAYDGGRLGPRLWEGGDGTAEARYVESVALVARQVARLDAFAAAGTEWDLLVTYLPYPDESLHRWYGRLDPVLPGHDPALARGLRPYLDRVLAILDGYAGRLEDTAGPGALFVLATDHGMTSASRTFRPNAVLREAGLLALDAAGGIDLARTRAVYFPGNTGHVRLNRAALPGGIVPVHEEAAVRREVAAALGAARDPASGLPLEVRVFDLHAPPSGDGPARGGPGAGDLFVEIGARGFTISADHRGAVVSDRAPEGAHFQDPASRPMQGTLIVAGPGVAPGADLGLARQIDIAPTVAALLGIDPPRDAAGKPIAAALARRKPPAK